MRITLIGMPGSGKSYVGKKLAETLGCSFIETDKLLEDAYSIPLQQLLEKLGDEAFLRAEEDAVLAALGSAGPLVLSPGGSIVYSDRAMRRVSQLSLVVYLRASLPTLERRMGIVPRGIVGSHSKTLAELYKERAPLHEKWGSSAVDADLPAEQVVKDILNLFRNFAKY